jgi:hypothetical protein
MAKWTSLNSSSFVNDPKTLSINICLEKLGALCSLASRVFIAPSSSDTRISPLTITFSYSTYDGEMALFLEESDGRRLKDTQLHIAEQETRQSYHRKL